jgi:hypothetical protein
MDTPRVYDAGVVAYDRLAGQAEEVFRSVPLPPDSQPGSGFRNWTE